MTVSAPLKVSSLNGLTCLHAAAMLVPAVILFCAVLETFDINPMGATADCSLTPMKTGIVIYECGVRPTSQPAYDGPVTLVQEQCDFSPTANVQAIQETLWPELDAERDRTICWGESFVESIANHFPALIWKMCFEHPIFLSFVVCGMVCGLGRFAVRWRVRQ